MQGAEQGDGTPEGPDTLFHVAGHKASVHLLSSALLALKQS